MDVNYKMALAAVALPAEHRHAGADYSFYQPPKKKRAPPSCPHGIPLGISINFPACCQKATPEDINLPQGEIPEFPDLPPLDLVYDFEPSS